MAQGKAERNEEDELKYEGTNMSIQSLENEKKVLRRVIMLAMKQLKVYPTSIDEDEKILKDEKGLTFNTRNCVLMRLGEKRVHA